MTVFELKTMQACEITEPVIVALGVFDGCHLGHASVLRNAFYKAKELKIKSLVYTFDSMPMKEGGFIFTLDEKIRAIRKFGIDYIAIDSFERVKELSGKRFFEEVLTDRLKSVGACCGFNYRFGKGAECDALELKSFFENNGGSVQISEKIMYGDTPISSTLMKSKIQSGEVEELLMYATPYSIYAEVERGKGLGHKMGFATINQKIPYGKVVPKLGVYITECEIGEDVYPCITNVGFRPTTDGEGSFLNVETHIIGFNDNLYSSYVRVNFYKYVRSEMKFRCVEELFAQIERDKQSAVEYFLHR